MTITATQTIEDSSIEAGMTGEVLNVDDLGQTWVSFRTSEFETVLYPFSPQELADWTE